MEINTGNFDITFDGSLAAALGFSQSTYTGVTDISSDLVPLAFMSPLGITYDAPWPAQEAELRKYRWGRVSARVHHRAMITTVSVLMTATQAETLLGGPLFTSKVRLYPHGYTSGAYAADNLRGYLDVYPYEVTEVKSLGADDVHTQVTFVGSMVE